MAEQPQDQPDQHLIADLLAACRRSRREAAELLWELGADKLRRSAGDPGHLERLLGNELFSPLIGFDHLEYEPLERIEDSSRQIVTVFPGEGAPARFMFALKRSKHGEAEARWSITGLERVW